MVVLLFLKPNSVNEAVSLPSVWFFVYSEQSRITEYGAKNSESGCWHCDCGAPSKGNILHRAVGKIKRNSRTGVGCVSGFCIRLVYYKGVTT